MLRFLKRNTACMLKFKYIHYTLGYALIFIAQLDIYFGVKAYYLINPKANPNLAVASIIVFFTICTLVEVYYQYLKRSAVTFNNKRQFCIGINQLHERLAVGQ